MLHNIKVNLLLKLSIAKIVILSKTNKLSGTFFFQWMHYQEAMVTCHSFAVKLKQ
jgi:hypothetical protein